MRCVLFASLLILGAGAYVQTDSILWTKSFYAPNNETILKVDSADNVYLGYVSGTPSLFTLKKFSPEGVVLWSSSIPYSANENTKAQLMIGPDGDPYLGWTSGISELRRFNRLNGQQKWKIAPPMLKFNFAIYEKISVYGDRPTGSSSSAAQCLTYTLDGKLTTSTGFESGFTAGQVWDGLVRYDTGSGPITQRMLIKTRYKGTGGQVIIGDKTYPTLMMGITALGVNQSSPVTRVIVGGPTFEGAIGETYEYGTGRTSVASWAPPAGPPFTTLPYPTDVRTSSRSPFFSVLNTGKESLYPFAADGSAWKPWRAQSNFVGGGSIVGTFDGEGIYHSLRTRDGLGAVLDEHTLLAASSQARSPQIEIDSRGHAIVSYIKQNGSPIVVVSKVFMAIGVQTAQKKSRVNQTITWDAGAQSRGFDDGTDNPHFSIITPPSHGTATMDGDGKITYTPHANFIGQDTMNIRVSKIGSSADGELNVFVKPNIQSITATDIPSGAATLVTIAYDQATPDFAAEEFAIKFSPTDAMAGTTWSNIHIPGNQISGSKSYQAKPVTIDRTVTVTATAEAGGTHTTTFLIRKPILDSVFMVDTVKSGNKFSLRVNLTGYAASNQVVALSDDSSMAATPSSLTVVTGAISSLIQVQTNVVAVNTSCTVTATLNGITKTDTITLLP